MTVAGLQGSMLLASRPKETRRARDQIIAPRSEANFKNGSSLKPC